MIKMKRIIKTTNKEIYNKLNMLSFSTDVVLKGVNKRHIKRILNNINKNKKVLELEKIGDYFLLKKRAPLDVLLYFVKK